MIDDSWTNIILDDVYDTFHKDKEAKTKIAKESEDMALSIMKESEKATVKDYTKLVVTHEMVDYVLEKYANNWKCEVEIAYVILEDLWLEYRNNDKRKGNEVEHAEVVQIFSDEDNYEDPTASTSTRFRAPIASTFNA
nr:hypothetical protein [Tanacetum cinerariifolium]